MEYLWLNNGEPDDEGNIKAIIKNTDGRTISQFSAKTEREMTEQLLRSQVNANRLISTLRRPDTGKPPLKIEPRELTAADRLRLSSEITDPNKVVEAVDEIITARQGLSPDKLGEEFKRKSQEEQDSYINREAVAFRDGNPDYYPVPQNFQAIVDELKARNFDWTRNNLALVYDSLKEKGKMIPWPDETQEPEAEANPKPNGNGQALTATPRPRTIATTGLRNSDSSELPPAPQPKRQKYTRADIERMSRQEYNDKLRYDPDFRRQVDAMSA